MDNLLNENTSSGTTSEAFVSTIGEAEESTGSVRPMARTLTQTFANTLSSQPDSVKDPKEYLEAPFSYKYTEII